MRGWVTNRTRRGPGQEGRGGSGPSAFSSCCPWHALSLPVVAATLSRSGSRPFPGGIFWRSRLKVTAACLANRGFLLLATPRALTDRRIGAPKVGSRAWAGHRLHPIYR